MNANHCQELTRETPTVSASLDKTAYAEGETMTLRITYARGRRIDADPTELGYVSTLIQVTDGDGSKSRAVKVAATITPKAKPSDALTLAVDDRSDHTWTKVSDNGTVAVYTAIA